MGKELGKKEWKMQKANHAAGTADTPGLATYIKKINMTWFTTNVNVQLHFL